MRAWMKRHKILTGVGALLLVPVTLGGLNYSGMCLAEGRWLSDEEKIRLVLQNFRGRADSNYLREHLGDREADKLREEYDPIPYQSPDDFKQQNPDCCKMLGPDSNKPYWGLDSSSRFFGYRADVIELHYTARFRHKKNGKIITLPDHTEYKVITNCGEVIWRF